MIRRFCALATVLVCLILAPQGGEATPRLKDPSSDIDPSIMRIDEVKYLGAKLDGETALIAEDGREIRLADVLGKPVILVLAYYTCDGSCSIINSQLADLLPAVKRVVPGEDYRILTLSFDQHDNLETTGAFKKHLANIRGFEHAWTFATFKNKADLEAQTEKIGFKFFWSFKDRMFLHPGAFLFLNAEGRLARVLYPAVEPQDIELAIYDAKEGNFRPQEIVKYAINLCYSYSYADGKYVLNIPIFVGAGAFALGFAVLVVAVIIFKRRMRRGRYREKIA